MMDDDLVAGLGVYDREGVQITKRQRYLDLFSDDDYRRVALDEVPGYHISTVWLGVNHNYGSGPPLIFETMVFEVPSGEVVDTFRYATEAKAVQGHAELLTLVMATT